MTKVLLVEDDNNLREIYEARLAAEGYDIATAKDGEDALAVAKQQKPDLIISDVMMPRISGFEMLDILRNTDGLKHTKVIMLTALGQNEDKTRADSLGADRYLVKSQVTLEDIVKSAEELLNPDAQTDAAAESVPETPSAAPATSAPSPQAAPVPAAPQPTGLQATPGVVTAPIDPNVGADMPAHDGSIPTLPTAQPSEPPQAEPPVAAPPQDAPVAAEPPQTPGLSLPTPTEPAPAAPIQPAVTTAPADAQTPAADPTVTPAPSPDAAVAGESAPEPHTVITPPNQDVTSSSEPPAATPASSATPPSATPSDTPFITQPQPQAQPEAVPTEPAVNELPVVPAPDPVQPTEAPTDSATPAIQMPANPEFAATTVPAEAQTASQEEATVEKQIESFVNEHQDATPEAVPTSDVTLPEASMTPQSEPSAPGADPTSTTGEPSSNNEQLIANAMSDLLDGAKDDANPADVEPVAESTPGTEAEPEPAAAEADPNTPAPQTESPEAPIGPVGDGNTQITGRKVLQPITADEQKADLSELVAKEEVKENIAKGVAGDAVVSDPNQQSTEPTPGVTPSPPPAPHASQQPGGVFTPNTGGDADANAL